MSNISDDVIKQIKEIGRLKEEVYSVDLNKTIMDMLTVIQNMEAQLKSVLAINASLKKDLNDSKEIIAELKGSKSRLEATIARMEAEMPLKRDLQMEIEYHIEERNKAEQTIRRLREEIGLIRAKGKMHS